jgi:glycosyltransferase involved in cell wall biosynthesis
MPSRFEGLGLVAIESTLAGLPVIATDAEGLREALPPDHPWIARVGDAASFAAVLQAALEYPDRWAPAVAAAQAFARNHFDFPSMCRAYLQVYRSSAASR